MLLERQPTKLTNFMQPSPSEKLTTVLKLVVKFPAFYGTRRFTTVFTTVWYSSLSWATRTRALQSYLFQILHLFLGLPSSMFPSTTTLHTFFYSPLYMPHASSPPPSYLIWSPKQNMLRNTNHAAPHYAVLSITFYLLPLRSKYLSQRPLLKHPPPKYCPLLCNTKLHGHTKQAK
jgi:hypothetical protein